MISLKNIEYAYSSFKVAVDDLVIPEGITALMGESGCGKSTLLNIINGLVDLDKGRVFWEGKAVLGPAYNLVPGVENMNYLAQKDQLMPYTTVASNVQKFLSRQDMASAEKITAELLELVGLENLAKRVVKTLSSGQQQRVAIAQVLAKKPKLLLMDEAFNFIDAFQRHQLRRRIFAYLKKENVSCIYATHDREDVLGFADRILVLKNGEVENFKPTKALYQEPETRYAAGLFGDINRLEGARFGYPSKSVVLYPDELKIADRGIEARVKACYFQGGHYLIRAKRENRSESIVFYWPTPVSCGIEIRLVVDTSVNIKKRRV